MYDPEWLREQCQQEHIEAAFRSSAVAMVEALEALGFRRTWGTLAAALYLDLRPGTLRGWHRAVRSTNGDPTARLEILCPKRKRIRIADRMAHLRRERPSMRQYLARKDIGFRIERLKQRYPHPLSARVLQDRLQRICDATVGRADAR